ncbi:hypothetical protein BMS3Abin06_00217 [bacterium BMS3Abin06]|nr:hypothetical protein BMS3Abin06_00217 [bacterium BMS3Abin06]
MEFLFFIYNIGILAASHLFFSAGKFYPKIGYSIFLASGFTRYTPYDRLMYD